jgi:membrane protein DedA with SNARE-associated domain
LPDDKQAFEAKGTLMLPEFDHEKIIAFVQAKQHLAPLIVFFLAMGETIIVLSLFIPSTVLLFAVGGLLAASGVPLIPALIAGGLGASIGFTFSYLLGATMNERILRLWPLRNHLDTVEQTRQFAKKWGVWAVLFGHFSGPLRPVVPLLAGMSHMPPLPFFAANVPGAFAWIATFLAPGYLVVSSPQFQILYDKARAFLP